MPDQDPFNSEQDPILKAVKKVVGGWQIEEVVMTVILLCIFQCFIPVAIMLGLQ